MVETADTASQASVEEAWYAFAARVWKRARTQKRRKPLSRRRGIVEEHTKASFHPIMQDKVIAATIVVMRFTIYENLAVSLLSLEKIRSIGSVSGAMRSQS